jgi:UTP--glucose-1-phosphate uridylyltransferase
MSLQDELAGLPAKVRETLRQHNFDEAGFLERARRLSGEVSHSNLMQGQLEPPSGNDIVGLPESGSSEEAELIELGMNALREGHVAFVVLAGGMATRMGGVVKSLLEVLPGQRFLDLRLNERMTLERRAGRRVPLWLMTSDATDAAIVEALGARRDADYLQTFVQFLSPRLTPEGTLFRDDSGEVSLHSPGHGDLPDALRASGLLARFVERGGRYVTVTNIDNLGASLDPVILGFHIRHGKPVTCEVVDKVESDKGGIPVRVNGRPVVLEEFRIPPSFDPKSVRVFSTNTFHIDAKALLDLKMDWTYFTVEKVVDGRKAIQFERLINEITSGLDTQYLRLPREGKASRFLPVKDFKELERRLDEITLVARDRGMTE